MLSVQSKKSIPTGRRRGVAVALTLGLAATTAACGVSNSDDNGGSAAGDTVRIVLPEEPPTLEPCESSLTSTGVVVRSNITEPLVERDPTSGELNPLLATEWEQSSETEWTFKLREDVTFSDGTPFDAEAAAYSLERAVNSDLGCNVEGYVFGDVDLGIEVVDATTLTVSTPEPDPILPLRISFVEIVPTSTSDTEKVREPIGTGPYRIDSWEAGQKLTLAANPEYWGDAPAYDEATYEWRSEGTVRAAMVLNDEADVATNIGPDDGAGDTAIFYPNNETTALRMQSTTPPLDDIRVRQAINYAIDREGLTESLFAGDAVAAAQLVPEGVVGHNSELEPWPTDMAEAETLLAEAEADGVDLSPEIRLVGRTALFPKVDETVQVIQKSLEDLGLNVTIEMMDTTGTTELQERPFPEDAGPYLLLIQHGNQAGDAIFSMEQYLLSNGFQSSGGTRALDQKVKAAALLEGEERQAALAEVFAEEPEAFGQYAYLAHMNGVMAVAEGVAYEPNSATGDEMRLAEMSPAS
ncbi:MAG: ABC transporter substrate-binding protein [Actinomycetota bacterium]|nr:ABC transporter substrate-binding protein [Actinomycetota bacterium]